MSKIENFEELNTLSHQKRELVLEEYRKGEHPYQIRIKVWLLVLPMVISFAAIIYFETVMKIEFNISFIEKFCFAIILGFIASYIIKLIELYVVAPIVIKSIIKKLERERSY